MSVFVGTVFAAVLASLTATLLGLTRCHRRAPAVVAGPAVAAADVLHAVAVAAASSFAEIAVAAAVASLVVAAHTAASASSFVVAHIASAALDTAADIAAVAVVAAGVCAFSFACFGMAASSKVFVFAFFYSLTFEQVVHDSVCSFCYYCLL